MRPVRCKPLAEARESRDFLRALVPEYDGAAQASFWPCRLILQSGLRCRPHVLMRLGCSSHAQVFQPAARGENSFKIPFT